MMDRNGLRSWLRAALVGMAATNGAIAGDYCFSAPRCWQYHRDVCFGHYQTRWRRWDEACGPALKPTVEPANQVTSSFHEPHLPTSLNAPLTIASIDLGPPAVQEPRAVRSPPPAAVLLAPAPVLPALPRPVHGKNP